MLAERALASTMHSLVTGYHAFVISLWYVRCFLLPRRRPNFGIFLTGYPLLPNSIGEGQTPGPAIHLGAFAQSSRRARGHRG